MTRPDPYIEEVMSNFDKEFTYNGVKGDYRLKITSAADLKSFIRTALETQKSATKRQRIKDIEEIDKDMILFREKEEFGNNKGDAARAYGFNLACEIFRQILTSRKAAIEEI